MERETLVDRMKILKVWSFWQEDIKYHDHYLAEAMLPLGVETTFLAPDKVEKSLWPFLKQVRFDPGERLLDFYRVIRLRSVDFFGKFIVTDLPTAVRVTNRNYDVIHIFGISNMITFLILTILLLKRKRPVIVVSDHSHPDDKKTSLAARLYYLIFKLLFKIYAPMIERLIVPNLPSLRYLKERYSITDESIFKIIPLGFHGGIFRHDIRKKNTSSELVIGFAGKIYPEKCIEKLIRALVAFGPDEVRLVIAGINIKSPSDYQRRLIDLVASLKLPNVEFRKFIDSPVDLAEYYNYIDVAVFPGSLSITTLEASGCGTPVILFESTEGLEDRVDNGRGVLFETEPEMISALRRFVALKKSNGIDNVHVSRQSQRFAWDNISQLYIEEYQRIDRLHRSNA